jgi:hypothetical protein
MTCPKCLKHYLTPENEARGIRCRCSDHCPCKGSCNPGCACEQRRSEVPKTDGRHDFTVFAGKVAYCRFCAKPELEMFKRLKCLPLPSEVAERRIAHKLDLIKRFTVGGGR